MPLDVEALERATLDAVAPEAIEVLSDWLLPFDQSTVGRAISAVPLKHHSLHPPDIELIEARYAARGMRTQFRIADVTGLAEVQSHLRMLGYRAHQPTLTMTCDIAQWQDNPHSWRVRMNDTPTTEWETVYLAADFDTLDGANRVKALSRSECVTYAWIEDKEETIAAATAAMSQGWMSLHGLRTVKRAQRQGCAQALIDGLVSYARSKHMVKCFLQVEEGNMTAVALYRRLGFQTAWRYHYWRKDN